MMNISGDIFIDWEVDVTYYVILLLEQLGAQAERLLQDGHN